MFLNEGCNVGRKDRAQLNFLRRTFALLLALTLVLGMGGLDAPQAAEPKAKKAQQEDKPDAPLGIASSRRGEIGLMRMGAAIIPPQTTFSILATIDYWAMSDLFAEGIDQKRMENSGNFSFSLADFWELYISGSSTSHLIEDTILDDRLLAQSIGDFLLGMKWAYPANDFFWIGADFTTMFRTERGGIGPAFDATGIETRMLVTLDFTTYKTPKPVRLNFNFGFLHDKAECLVKDDQGRCGGGDPISRYALGIPYDNQALVSGLSLEIPQNFINIFVEYYTTQYIDFDNSQPGYLAGRSFKTNPQYLTPGVRLFPVAGMHIDVAVDMGHNLFSKSARYDIQGLGQLHKIEPDWNLHFGVGYLFLPPKPELPKEGRVWGVVYDGRDRRPVEGARISFPGSNLSTLLTMGDGKFRSYQFPAGPVKVRVDADKYQSVETTVTALAGQDIRRDFVLKYVEQAGELIGQITDSKGKGLPGSIEFKEEGVDAISADAKTGQFQVKLKPGIYTLKAMAPGFDPDMKRVRVADQKRTVVNFILQPTKIVGTLRGTVKDPEGAPVQAIISFGASGLQPMNVDPNTGAFDSQLPPGTYTAKAMAPGYDPVEKPIKIIQDSITVLDFVLEESQKVGKIMGTTVDAKTGKGVYAVVSFPNGERENIPTDPDSGKFVAEMEPGEYQVKAANPNYKATVLTVKVEKGKETAVNFQLKPYEKVRVTEEKVEIKEKIAFTTGKSTIKIDSYPILDEIAQVLKEIPDMKLVVEGHTDSIGDAGFNKTLSSKRAGAVRDYILSRGINAERMTAVGYGEERPIADNATEDGRAKNRRVEFKIIK